MSDYDPSLDLTLTDLSVQGIINQGTISKILGLDHKRLLPEVMSEDYRCESTI